MYFIKAIFTLLGLCQVRGPDLELGLKSCLDKYTLGSHTVLCHCVDTPITNTTCETVEAAEW